MTKWYAVPRSMRTSPREYRANVEGMNIVFGAVLGFVLANVQTLGTFEFTMVLGLSASAVIAILYLGSSDYKLFYAVMAAIIIAALPRFFAALHIPPIEKLQPTLGAWAGMVLFLEMMPRTRPENQENQQETMQ